MNESARWIGSSEANFPAIQPSGRLSFLRFLFRYPVFLLAFGPPIFRPLDAYNGVDTSQSHFDFWSILQVGWIVSIATWSILRLAYARSILVPKQVRSILKYAFFLGLVFVVSVSYSPGPTVSAELSIVYFLTLSCGVHCRRLLESPKLDALFISPQTYIVRASWARSRRPVHRTRTRDASCVGVRYTPPWRHNRADERGSCANRDHLGILLPSFPGIQSSIRLIFFGRRRRRFGYASKRGGNLAVHRSCDPRRWVGQDKQARRLCPHLRIHDFCFARRLCRGCRRRRPHLEQIQPESEHRGHFNRERQNRGLDVCNPLQLD